MRRVLVITGDHMLSDPTKHRGAYGPEDLKTHTAMCEAVAGFLQFDATVTSDHEGLFERLIADPPDLVVNFCDTGVNNVPTHELHLPAWLELNGIPYTGASPEAIAICFDKQIVRLVAEALGVEVPREVFLPRASPASVLPDIYPALLKPNSADGSVGITKDAVVRDEAEARAYLDFLARELPGKDVLWQEYLPGPEFGMGLIGNPATGIQVLPPLQVDFSGLPIGLAPILSFESKTDPSSPYWSEIRFARAEIDRETTERMEGWCTLLFRRFGLRDYGRFDFRCAADGRPRLLETNPNPAWANDGKLAFMASFAGIRYSRMLEMIIEAAVSRVSA